MPERQEDTRNSPDAKPQDSDSDETSPYGESMEGSEKSRDRGVPPADWNDVMSSPSEALNAPGSEDAILEIEPKDPELPTWDAALVAPRDPEPAAPSAPKSATPSPPPASRSKTKSSAASVPPEPPKVAVSVIPDWFAVRVQSNKEDSVKRNLERRIELRGLNKKILQVVVPTEKVAEIKGGKKRTRQVKTYPGYVLIEMLMDDETWAFVRETAGVGDFVGGGGNIHQKPFPLRADEVNKIFGLEVPGQESPKIKIDFNVGDKVKIREGPFENFDGVVEEINEQKGLVRVTVTIFGRATPVELQYWQVEAI